jgi:hypothetical protein
MIVEFIGAPGSGKSSIAHDSVRRLCAGGVRASYCDIQGFSKADGLPRSDASLHFDRAISLLTTPRLSAALVQTLVTNRRPEMLSWLLNLSRRNRAARGARQYDGVLFLDDGPLHGICSGITRTQMHYDSEIFAMFLERIRLPDVVIVLWIPPEVAHQRLCERDPRHILSRTDERAAVAHLARQQEIAESVAALLRDRVHVFSHDITGLCVREASSLITTDILTLVGHE